MHDLRVETQQKVDFLDFGQTARLKLAWVVCCPLRLCLLSPGQDYCKAMKADVVSAVDSVLTSYCLLVVTTCRNNDLKLQRFVGIRCCSAVVWPPLSWQQLTAAPPLLF